MAIKTIYPQNDATWMDYDTGSNNSIDYKKDQILGWGTMRYEDGGGSSAWDRSRPVFQFDVNAVPTVDRINSVVLGIYVSSQGWYNQTNYYIDRTRTWLPDENSPGRNEMNMSVVADQRVLAFTNPATFEGWYRFNVTAAVKAGKNEGIVSLLLNYDDKFSLEAWLNVWTRESGGRAPYLEIDWVENQAPNAPNLSTPVHGGWYGTGSPTVSWSFSDPDAGDTQGNAVVYIIDHNTGSVIRDTGWNLGSAKSWVVSPPLPSGTYRYRVITQDQLGWSGPWSGEPIFYVDVNAPSATGMDNTTYSNVANGYRKYLYGVGDNMGVSRVNFWDWWNGAWIDRGTGTNAGGGTWYYDFPYRGAGTYQIDTRVYDNAGNVSNGNTAYTSYHIIDTVRAADPNVLAGGITANAVTFTWSAFSDTAPSSGYAFTRLYVRKNGVASSVDIDSNGSIEDFITFTDGRTSFTCVALVENTNYSFVVTHYDKAGNESNYAWKTVQTNARPTASVQNLAAAGYLLNPRPKIRVSGNDPESSAMNFHLQISSAADFSTLLIDSQAVGGGAAWSNNGRIGNGVANTFTPQADITVGTRYVRVRAHDGQDWGNWSAGTAIVIQNPNWVGTISATDKTASKRWIDDLRNKVNAIRQARGVAVKTWTDPLIRNWDDSLGGTQIRTVHITELRQAMQDVATIYGVPLTWTATDLTGANRSGQEWLDLRNAALKL